MTPCMEGREEQTAAGYSVTNSFPTNRSFPTEKKANTVPKNPGTASAQHPLAGLTRGQGKHWAKYTPMELSTCTSNPEF